MNGKEVKQLAVLGNEVQHIKEKQSEMTSDVKEIKSILLNGASKISINRQSIRANTARVKRIETYILGGIGAVLATVLGVAAKIIFF